MKKMLFFLLTSLVYINYFAKSGDLDPSFGASFGYTLTSIDAKAITGRGLVRQADGKIVVVGNYYDAANEKYSIVVARYSALGILDVSFGSSGIVKTTLPNSTIAQCVALQSNGKIVVAANYDTNRTHGITVMRYTTSGVLDNTFGSGRGYVHFVVNTMCAMNSLLVGPDNKITVGGWFAATDGSTDAGILMVRFTANGVVDTAFGTKGYVKQYVAGYPAVIQSMVRACRSSAIISTGAIKGARSDSYCLLMQTTALGKCINSFGKGRGYIKTAISGSRQNVGICLTLQPDCKIVVAGQYADIATGHLKLFLVRYNANGTIDTGFGSSRNGIVKASLSNGDDSIVALFFNRAKIVIVGSCVVNRVSTLMLARYTAAGARDVSFGSGGIVRMPIAESWSNGAFIRGDTLTIVGSSNYGTGTNQLLLARFKLA